MSYCGWRYCHRLSPLRACGYAFGGTTVFDTSRKFGRAAEQSSGAPLAAGRAPLELPLLSLPALLLARARWSSRSRRCARLRAAARPARPHVRRRCPIRSEQPVAVNIPRRGAPRHLRATCYIALHLETKTPRQMCESVQFYLASERTHRLLLRSKAWGSFLAVSAPIIMIGMSLPRALEIYEIP